MGDFTAFATITRALTDRLQRVASARGGAVANAVVQARAPGHDEQRHLPSMTVFLYHVTPNADFRNADLPTRNADGSLVERPSAAFDLLYLLSFYGADTPQRMETQMLWGMTVAEMHANPFITPAEIRRAQDALKRSAEDTQKALVDAHMLRIVPHGLDVDTLSRLWHSFPQANYTPSMVYKVGPCFVGIDDWPAPPMVIEQRDIKQRPSLSNSAQKVASAPMPVGQVRTPHVFGDGLTLAGVPVGTDAVSVGGVTLNGLLGPDGLFCTTLDDPDLPIGPRVPVMVGDAPDQALITEIDIRPRLTVVARSLQVDKDIKIKMSPRPQASLTVKLVLNAVSGESGKTILGELVPNGSGAEATFPPSGLPAGAYFVRVSCPASDGTGVQSESLLDWVAQTASKPAHFEGPILTLTGGH